jgi:hypothetical protein
VLITPLLLLALGCPASYFIYQRWSRHSAISTTCLWAGLAPLPVPESEVDVDVSGGMFTREFRISFTADMAAIKEWLNASPGVVNGFGADGEGARKYIVKPGGGAQYGEVRVDDATGRVTIRTYWS